MMNEERGENDPECNLSDDDLLLMALSSSPIEAAFALVILDKRLKGRISELAERILKTSGKP